MWDVTAASPLAVSYADIAATSTGLVADQAADRKADKYADFTTSCVFEPIAVENLGPSTLQHWSLSVIWVRESVTFLLTTERPSFYSSVSPCQSNV